jgi:hypothetical protein
MAAGLKTSAFCHLTTVFFTGQSNSKEESAFNIGLISVFVKASKAMCEMLVWEVVQDQIENSKTNNITLLSFMRLLFETSKKQKKLGITELFLKKQNMILIS